MLSILLFLCVPAAAQVAAFAVPGQPTFEWDASFASPGTSLQINQTPVFSGRGRGLASLCSLVASGFTAEDKLTLWQRVGTSAGPMFTRMTVTLGPNNSILIGSKDKMMIDGFARGQALDMAVVSETSGARAHAKVYFDPIEAKSAKGCSITIETVSETARDFVVWLSGFQPGVEVRVVDKLKKNSRSASVTVSESGAASLPLTFPQGSKGKVTLTASGGGCALVLEFGVGDLGRI
jgi:hypothetical protein